MSIKINLRPFASTIRAAFEVAAGPIKAIAGRVKADRRLCWMLRMLLRYFICGLALVVYTIAVSRYAQKQALETYAGWLEEYKAEQEAAAIAEAEADPYTIQLNAEAEMLARVLYGVKDNSTDDLKTYCWCVFNRVENKAFPDTLEDVIAQPSQWMRYDPTNPIIESLYQIAREQLNAWHTDTHRPVSSEYVFMNWSRNDICLRDNFYEGSGCHYWRYGQ